MQISNTKSKQLRHIAITTGDPNGIGFEVTIKALCSSDLASSKDNCLFFLFRDRTQEMIQPKLFRVLDKKWTRLTFESVDLALAFVDQIKIKNNHARPFLIDLALTCSAVEWVILAAELCKKKILHAMVTGPLSKTLIRSVGRKEVGHTGIFKTLFPKSTLHMAFVGKYFNVLLATDHIPLSKVEAALTKKNISASKKAALHLRKYLKLRKPIAVLGLNPHAGENTIIGSFEKKHLTLLNKPFVGPLVPDAAFLKESWNKYSVLLCLYHDQGLIPFKMIHGQDSGVHITVGLPFFRVSVDHGTAFSLFNKNIANPSSMLEAINLSMKTEVSFSLN